MRLFVALEVPAAALAPLLAIADALRPGLPPARWVPSRNLHLTLVFLGETDPELVPGLRAALGRVFARFAPLRLQLAGGGTFPPRRPARVAWIGLRPPEELSGLQPAVAAAVAEQLERPRERRPFHPHLTLARCRRPWPAAVAEAWRRAFADAEGPPFDVVEGALKQSILTPEGARHETVERFPLRGSGPG